MNIIFYALLGSIINLNARQQERDISLGNKICNMMLLDQFLTASPETLAGMAESMAAYAKKATGGQVPYPSNDIPIELLLKLQQDAQIANYIHGLDGVLDVLKEYGIEFSFEILPNSAADKVFAVHTNTATGWDWKALRDWLLTGAALAAVTFLGMTLYAKYKEKDETIAKLTKDNLESSSDWLDALDFIEDKGLIKEYNSYFAEGSSVSIKNPGIFDATSLVKF
jgi:hypothetical protein